MKKLLIALILMLFTPIFSIAEEIIAGYKKSETISLDNYLYDNSKRKNI